MAGLLLSFSEKYPHISLRKLFGDTHSKGPSNVVETGDKFLDYKSRYISKRIGIYWLLATSPGSNIKLAEINKFTNANPENINRQLVDMSNLELILYEQRNFSKNKNHTLISLDPTKKDLVTDLLYLLDNFQNLDRDVLRYGRFIGAEIISNPIRVAALLEKAKDNSSYANKSPMKETMAIISQIINSNKNISTSEIARILNENYGLIIKKVTVANYLIRLEKSGKIRHTFKEISRWSVTEN